MDLSRLFVNFFSTFRTFLSSDEIAPVNFHAGGVPLTLMTPSLGAKVD